MKKLLVAEAIAVALRIVIVSVGYIFRWPNETITAVIALAVGVGIVAFAAIAPNFVGVTSLVAATTLVATATLISFPTAAVTVFVAILAIGIITNDLKIKYHWVFLSLLSEGLIVWVILCCGPSLIKTIIGQ